MPAQRQTTATFGPPDRASRLQSFATFLQAIALRAFVLGESTLIDVK